MAANRNDLICGASGRDDERSTRSLHAACVSTQPSVWVRGGKTSSARVPASKTAPEFIDSIEL